jgi:hypothetical protein
MNQTNKVVTLWPRDRIVDVVREEMSTPDPRGRMKMVEFICFARLALGKPEGRASPADEDRLFRFVLRAMTAIERAPTRSRPWTCHCRSKSRR